MRASPCHSDQIMSITYNSNIVANLSPNGVSGWPDGVGLHRLRFSLQYQTPARKEVFVARNFRATVGVSRSHQGGAYLGIAWPESAWILRTGNFSDNAAILFDLDLRSEQLALIEQLREAGGLVFNLHFLFEVSHGDNIVRGDDDVRFHVNRSSWIACMKQFGQDRIVLLEVDLPTEEGSLKTAVALLKRAREELDAGNYDAVVQQCRRAIESVQKALKLKPAIDAAIAEFTKGERRRMTKRARALLVNEAALHYSHPAHHVDDDGETFDYGRRDAAFMLALASAVVANGVGGSE
jgi:hypothetical protein